MREAAMTTILLLIGFVLAAVHFAEAQQPKHVPVIGFLRSGSALSVAAEREAFLQALKRLGYMDGKNVTIEYRYAEGKTERWPELISDLVNIKVDIIVTAGIGPARTAKKATSTIPIVVGTAGDLVRTGIVASLAKPGGNVTGVTEIAPDLAGKRLELLKEIVPSASRVAVIWHSQGGASDDDEELKEIDSAARQFGMKVVSSGIRDAGELQAAYTDIAANKAHAAVILRNSVSMSNRKTLAQLAMKIRMPSMCDAHDFVHDGCLVSYGPDLLHNWWRAAALVDKILKGAKPADLPVEQPTKFELAINLKTAKQIGLTIPPNVLARADRVIK
jgi:putative tryptophan/tyrosine transport system substrate-binding protein